MKPKTDYIEPDRLTGIPELFEERFRRSPDRVAYRQYDDESETWVDRTWRDMHRDASGWQRALEKENLDPGDRVGILVRNSFQWVLLDLAALSSGFVVVPIFLKESHDHILHIIQDAGVKLLLVEDSKTWEDLAPIHDRIPGVERVVIVRRFHPDSNSDPRVRSYRDWFDSEDTGILVHDVSPDSPATIVYTSGTTGLPRGVILTHRNILWNARAGLETVKVYPEDLFLSFLPLTHMFERTVGYYLPMMAGATVVYARNVRTVAEDLVTRHPTMLVSVPLVFQRIYEKVKDEVARSSSIKQKIFRLALKVGYKQFEFEQNRKAFHPLQILQPLLSWFVGSRVRARLGGRLRLVVSGGAALPYEVWKLFVSLGIPIIQGYGMTELSPVVSVNHPEDNRGDTVGPLFRDVQVRIAENGEVLVRSPGVMKGYWHNEEATRQTIDREGWLHTGDVGVYENGHLKIVDRVKQIIVMSNGEKVPPERVELRIHEMGLFENLMIVGEDHPFLVLLACPRLEKLREYAGIHRIPYKGPFGGDEVHNRLLKEINERLRGFPGYVRVRRIVFLEESWTPENRMLTSSLKLKRKVIAGHYQKDIDEAYALAS